MNTELTQKIDDCLAAIEQLKSPPAIEFIEQAAEAITQAYQKGGKVLIAGNGGSLCDAMHFAEELTGYFREDRPALSAIALSDPGHITCVGNDSHFDQVFARGVEAHGNPGDVYIGLTTSGNSPNIIAAFEKAKAKGLFTMAFLGKTGGLAKGMADLELIISGFEYSDRIQEAHMTAIHLIIELIESKLFTKTPF